MVTLLPMAQHRIRASDPQRVAAWEQLDAAAADGRLDPLDHLRLGWQVRSSGYVDELRAILADLPAPARSPSEVAGTRSTPVARSRRAPRDPLDTAKLVGASTVAGLALVAGGVLALRDGAFTGLVGGTEDTITSSSVDEVISSARARFGDARVASLDIRGDYALLLIEDPSDPGAVDSWRRDELGEWAAEGEAFRPVDDLSVAMESIDVPAALEAARASAAENGLSDADLVGIDVGPDALAQPTYEITVSREGDRGHIVVGHDRIVREVGVPR